MSALTEHDRQLSDLERENRTLRRRLLRYEQSVSLLQEIQRVYRSDLEIQKQKEDLYSPEENNYSYRVHLHRLRKPVHHCCQDLQQRSVL